MTSRMLIDATHPEETRVVLLDNDQLTDFDFESSTKKLLKGNIYLAKVMRVEPSLQAAFVDYGGNRHGFLAFSEIHPDYFQIPVADRTLLEQADKAEVQKAAEAEAADAERPANGEAGAEAGPAEQVSTDAEEETAEVFDEQARRRARLLRSYKIQEVIKRRQIMLVQVVKEERGTKGAALTTYLSLAGRYCVLMPNTPRGGGISRKIASATDRRRLKDIVAELEVPDGMGLIVRTAGAERSKAELKRDYDYLLRLWSDIRERTLKSIAPCLIYEEANIIKRAIRDLYSRDIDEVLVDGEEGHRTAKRFMGMLMPSRARRVKPYKDELPLFYRYKVEDQLDAMYSPEVKLKSGGSIVIHATEALIAVDVNSGKSTRERHIEETAVKTNLEAAEEVARQLRLRDLAGLVVIDFIDMAEGRHQRQVERRLRDALKIDRARIQLGRISAFGLLELSRQRLRPSLQELSTRTCPTCAGLGVIRSTESSVLQVLRLIEEEGIKGEVRCLTLRLPTEVALYLLNHKRDGVVRLEQRYDMRVLVQVDPQLIPPAFQLERTETRETRRVLAPPTAEPTIVEAELEEEEAEDAGRAVEGEALAGERGEDAARKRRRRRRRRRRPGETEGQPIAAEARETGEEPDDEEEAAVAATEPALEPMPQPVAEPPEPAVAAEAVEEEPESRPRRRRRRPTRSRAAQAEEAAEPAPPSEPEVAAAPEAEAEARPGDEPAPEPAERAAGNGGEAAEPAPADERRTADEPLAPAGVGGGETDQPPRQGWWSRWVRRDP